MATKEKTTTAEQTEAEKVVAKATPAQTESVYTAEELAENARSLFGVRTECVAAALKVAGIKECTVSETKGIVEAFMKKEVK